MSLMADVVIRTEDWRTLPWRDYQRNVYRLQKRIYQAARRGDGKRVHSLQRLLLRSWSARCLATRQVTQDNRGKRTPGVDGIASLTPEERVRLAHQLCYLSRWTVDPIRRTYIPKPNNPTEKRGLGIPTMRDRAMQALVKLALEPEWEAVFEPNSYGFRPGRSTHDAIEAIFNFIRLQPKYVLDADIEKCFDRISHDGLLATLRVHAPQPLMRLIRAWFKTGILEDGQTLFPEAGTPQGGVLSPLLANIALHGFETFVSRNTRQHRVVVIRYADDFVILCDDLDVLLEAKTRAEAWLAEIGLQLKAAKTHITHTLNEHDGHTGFDFLGFTVQQYRVGKYRAHKRHAGYKTLITPSRKAAQRHLRELKALIRQYRGAPQAALIAELNPKIRGWTLYYQSSVAARLFNKLDSLLHHKLMRWASFRHPRKTNGWRYRRYWRQVGTYMTFSDGTSSLTRHGEMPITRHVKVKGDKSPYDGDWVYWGARLGRDPTKPKRVIWLLKQQHGRCPHCGLRFTTEDVLEVHHADGHHNNTSLANLVLLHAHCHDVAHSKRYQ
jgi:RNA-directed DNA polymerase